MDETYTLSKKAVDSLACTAQAVADHLEHGYILPTDARQLRVSAVEIEAEVQKKQKQDQQRMLWGD
jgi:hypothetical protein